jgi:hypothetical protein
VYSPSCGGLTHLPRVAVRVLVVVKVPVLHLQQRLLASHLKRTRWHSRRRQRQAQKPMAKASVETASTMQGETGGGARGTRRARETLPRHHPTKRVAGEQTVFVLIESEPLTSKRWSSFVRVFTTRMNRVFLDRLPMQNSSFWEGGTEHEDC